MEKLAHIQTKDRFVSPGDVVETQEEEKTKNVEYYMARDTNEFHYIFENLLINAHDINPISPESVSAKAILGKNIGDKAEYHNHRGEHISLVIKGIRNLTTEEENLLFKLNAN
jgi:transcription elongation GreA/GreB family factor